MIGFEGLEISWDAPIVPGVSLGGVDLDVDVERLELLFQKFIIDSDGALYRFCLGPELRLVSNLDDKGNGGYSFYISDASVISEFKRGVPALSFGVRNWKVCAIKVYDFSFPSEPAENMIYKGRLPGGVGLGSFVSDLLPYTGLEFNEAEEWFYTDSDYGVLEITGWGVPMRDRPDQRITAICVISTGQEEKV